MRRDLIIGILVSLAFHADLAVRRRKIAHALRMSEDRRQHERFELLAQVQLSHSTQFETFVTVNISAGGVLLRNDRNIQIAIGERIRIGFDAPQLAPAFVIDATPDDVFRDGFELPW